MLTRWNPWQDLFDIQREMNELGRRVLGSGQFMPLAGRPNGTRLGSRGRRPLQG